MSLFVSPLFTELAGCDSILIAGAGGGFDVFSGLPLYFALRAAGRRVHLANLSFSNLPPLRAGKHLTSELVEVTADSEGSPYYFPEKHLSQWFRDGGEEVPVYAIHLTGPRFVAAAYHELAARLKPDAVILVDGGTDSLMRGDEEGLGTPVEDMSSIAAVDSLPVPVKILVCLGFGIDAFHGVCHAHVLEAVADLTRAGGYLGVLSMLDGMPAVQAFRRATEYVLRHTPGRESIVLTSILSALSGHYGNHHATDRTEGGELFINPLMSLYWCFRLEAVARRILYLDEIRDLAGFVETDLRIQAFCRSLAETRASRILPM